MRDEIIDSIGKIDHDMIERVDALRQKKRAQRIRLKWGVLAACLCLSVTGALTFSRLLATNHPAVSQNAGALETAYSFTLKGKGTVYAPISFEERKMFGLVDPYATGLTDENTDRITIDDLGKIMGVVGSCENEKLVGASVYYFAKYPENDSICIVDSNGTYHFYVKANFSDAVEDDGETESPADVGIQTEIGEESDAVDAPADQNGQVYQEQPAYPADVLELQERISADMASGKLPYVVSSAVLENPLRLEIEVTTQDESLLNGIRAYDPTGKYIIIVPSEGASLE